MASFFRPSLIAVALGTSVGCSLITGASDFSIVGEPAGDDASTAPTCSDECPADGCGLVRLSCGPTDCGSCVNPSHRCVDTKCTCVPKTCRELGAECGALADECGGEVFCGACSSTDAGATDGGDAGATLYCGAAQACTAAPCVPEIPSVACFNPTVRLCGKQPDGCGGLVECGTSACGGVGETCGGGGKAGQCGCKPKSGCLGKCYSLCDDGCGGKTRCACNNCK